MKQETNRKRRVQLINPRLQLKLVGVFVGVSAIGFLTQALHVGLRLSELSTEMSEGGTELAAKIPGLTREILAVSFALLLPLITAIGVMITFRIAGPIHRFKQFLRDVRDGTEVHPCRLRSDDDLQDLCQVINDVTRPLRERNAERRSQAASNDDVAAQKHAA